MARNSSLIKLHDHDNYNILQLLTIDDKGNLLFNGKPIQENSSSEISDTSIVLTSNELLVTRHDKYEEEMIVNPNNSEPVLELQEINSSDLIDFADNITEI